MDDEPEWPGGLTLTVPTFATFIDTIKVAKGGC